MSDPIIPTRPEDPRPPQAPVIHNHVTVESGTSRLIDILATLLGCFAVGAIISAVAQSQLEIAASAGTVFAFQLAKLMISNGFIEIPKPGASADADIEGAKSALGQIWRGAQALIRKSPLWGLAILAAAYALGFVLMRHALVLGLSAFNNWLVSGAVAAAFAALVISQAKLKQMWTRRLGRKASRA